VPLVIIAAAAVLIVAAVVLILVFVRPFDLFSGSVSGSLSGGASGNPAGEQSENPAGDDSDTLVPKSEDPSRAPEASLVGTWTLGTYVGSVRGGSSESHFALVINLLDTASQSSIDSLKESLEKLPGVAKVIHEKDGPIPSLDVRLVDYAYLYGLKEKILEMPEIIGVIDDQNGFFHSIGANETPVMTLTEDGKAHFAGDPYYERPDMVGDYVIEGDTFVLSYKEYEASFRYRIEGDALIISDFQENYDIYTSTRDIDLLHRQVQQMATAQEFGEASLHRS
jgi:hypothetical protein